MRKYLLLLLLACSLGGNAQYNLFVRQNFEHKAGVAYDADAQAFITAAGLTNPIHKSAINQLVLDLKSYGLWTKMKAIYPIIGGTAFTHKFNLKDPRDLAAAFVLSNVDLLVNSSTGLKRNGSSNIAVTNLIPNSVLSLNSTHISFYSRDNTPGNSVEMGVPGSNALFIAPNFNGTSYRAVNNAQVSSVSSVNMAAYFIASRISSTTIKLYRNSSIINTDTVTSVSLSTIQIALIGYNGNGNYPSVRECAFATIGDGLDDTEAANLYTAVQAYQTTLGRQI